MTTTRIARLLRVAVHVTSGLVLRRRLHPLVLRLVVVILSLASLAWLSQQAFSGRVTVSHVRRSSVSLVAATQSTRLTESTSRWRRRRLFVHLPSASARLGNRMFAHASLLGLAADAGLQPTVSLADDKNILRSTFNLTTPVIAGPATDTRTVHWPWRTSIYVPPPSNLTAGDDDLLVVGYFQSWRYFRAVDERVRAEFRFRKHVADAAAGVVQRLTDQRAAGSEDLVLVGVHVRRNDMALECHRRRGYTVADEHYMRRAMSYVAGMYNQPSKPTQPCIPPGSLNPVILAPASAGWREHCVIL